MPSAVQVVPSPGVSAVSGGMVGGELQEVEKKLDLSSFPPEVKDALSAFDTDGDGIEVHELRAAAEKWAKSKGNLNSFDLAAFPEGLQSTLKSFDQDGDGTVNKTELAQAAKMYSDSKRNVRMLRKVVAVMSFVLLLTLGAVMGLVWVVVDMSKETKTADDGVMMVKGGAKPVQTARLTVQLPLGALPRMPPDFLENLEQLTVLDGLGMPLIRKLQGIDRLSSTSIVMHTTMGDMISILSATDGAIKLNRPSSISSSKSSAPIAFNSSASDKDSFGLCTACGHCAAVNVVLDETTKPIVDKYWADVDILWAAGGPPVQACLGKLERSTAGGGGRRLATKYRRLTDGYQCAEEPDCSMGGYAKVMEGAITSLATGIVMSMNEENCAVSPTSFCCGSNPVTQAAYEMALSTATWGPYAIASMHYLSMEFMMEPQLCSQIHDLNYLSTDAWKDEICPYWEGVYMSSGYEGMMGMLMERLMSMLIPQTGPFALVTTVSEAFDGLARRLQEESKLHEERRLSFDANNLKCGSGVQEVCEGSTVSAGFEQGLVDEVLATGEFFLQAMFMYMSSALSPNLKAMLNSIRCMLTSGIGSFLTSILKMMTQINSLTGGAPSVPQEFFGKWYPWVCTCTTEAAGLAEMLAATGDAGASYQTCSARRLAEGEVTISNDMSDPTHAEYARQVVRQMVRR